MNCVTATQKTICQQSFLSADRRVLNGAFPNKRQNPFVRMAIPQRRRQRRYAGPFRLSYFWSTTRQSILAEVSGPRLKLGHIEQLS